MPPIPRRLAILAKATQRALTDWDAPGVRLLTTSLLIYEAVLNALLIRFVACMRICDGRYSTRCSLTATRALPADTEIDWTAYMQQVRAFVGGQRDYAEIRGDTGPLV